MKKRICLLRLCIGLLFVAAGLCSCSEEDLASTNVERVVVNLDLPEFIMKYPNTRSTSERAVNSILAVVIRDGKAYCGQGSNFNQTDNTVSATLTGVAPQSGETLYLFCNTGLSSVSATDEADLLSKVSFQSPVANTLVMYGRYTVSDPAAISLNVDYSIAKAGLTCSAPGYTIESWKVCNAPSQGYAGETTGYPSGTTFDTEVSPDAGFAYFIPRTDNSTAVTKTYLIAKLKDMGWFRLDFYDKKASNGMTETPVMVDLEKNAYYKFNVLSVTSQGYDSEAEAAANIGSNIEYTFEAVQENSATNGQYMLQANYNEITLFPVSVDVQQRVGVTLSAIIPDVQGIDISTYSVKLVSPNKMVSLVGTVKADGYMDLMQSGTKLTTGNSKRDITIQFSGARMEGTYLEARLGDIRKQIPIRIMTSNCYLYDFTQAGRTLLIPIAQANLDKERISEQDNVTPEVVWSDQPNLSLNMVFNKTAGWIEIKNDNAFTGNVVIAANVNGETKWSWHIWSMGNSVLEFDSNKGIYDIKSSSEREFNNFTWMDRNLGAYDLTPGTAASRGLYYQWGRKDPFPGGKDKDDYLQHATVYCGATSFTINGTHPDYGSCIESPVNETNLDYSIQYPIRIIIGRKYNLPDGWLESDWYAGDYSKRNNYLWLTASKNKTAYNPCPSGWTLPYGGNSSPFVGLWPSDASIDTYGMTWGNTYYPFNTYIDATVSGALNTYLTGNVNGSVSLPWGDSDDTGKTLTVMDATEVLLRMDYCRAQAMPVRCVRE